MHFLVINPNTSVRMTASIKKTVDGLVSSDTSVDVIRTETGPESLESFFEYNLAAAAVVTTLKKIEIEKYDGVLLACFGDPGLYGLKESLPCPILGIAEASLSMSLLLGYKFAILVALEKAVPMMSNMVQQYGLADRMAGVFSIDLPVLDVEAEKTLAVEKILRAGKKALEQGAEVLILGCAGMTGISKAIEERLEVPVIDPVTVGFNCLKAVVDSGLKIARRGLYGPVPGKGIPGLDEPGSN